MYVITPNALFCKARILLITVEQGVSYACMEYEDKRNCNKCFISVSIKKLLYINKQNICQIIVLFTPIWRNVANSIRVIFNELFCRICFQPNILNW